MAPEVGQRLPSQDADPCTSALSARLSACYDEKCDVYSFGLVLWEMAHCALAFEGLTGLNAAQRAAAGTRPPISLPPERAPFAELIAAGWCHDPAERLPMHACAERLGRMVGGGGEHAALHPPFDTSMELPVFPTPYMDEHHTAKLDYSGAQWILAADAARMAETL